MQSNVKLDGVVEADETFFAISYKGNHKSNFKLPRVAHQRWSLNFYSWLSKEQVCVPCVVNLNGLLTGTITNLGKPSFKDLEKLFTRKI